MKLTFQQKTELEQIRAIEENCVPLASKPLRAEHFNGYLSARLEHLLRDHSLKKTLERPRRFYRLLFGLLLLVAALAGTAATFKAVAGPAQTLNVFWILVVLLGFNCLSFLLWLVLTLVSPNKKAGPLGNLFNDLLRSTLHRIHNTCQARNADAAWLQNTFAGPVGRWQLGVMTHCAWLAYLGAGLLALLLILATRQYDFIWGSTLLSDTTYAHITAWLAAPMHALGWPVVTQEQVSLSQMGQPTANLAGARTGWAWFLMGSLLLYGLLPRLVAWLLCLILRKISAHRWQLNTHLPYYLQLQRVWQPPFSNATVLDADQHPPGASATRAENLRTQLPEGALLIGLELQNSGETVKAAVNVCDTKTADQAATLIAQSKAPVVLLSDAHKVPDRGLLRAAKNLLASRPGDQRWLAVIKHESSDDHFEQWLAATPALGLPPQQCILVADNDR